MSIAQFRQGSAIFDIDGTLYGLGTDFAPPGQAWMDVIAAGTSLNRYGGGEMTDWQATNIPLSFSVIIQGANEGQSVNAASRLTHFLNSVRRRSYEPAYFDFKPYDIKTPLWGQFGGWRSCEIVSVNAKFTGEYGEYQHDVMVVQVDLTVKPFARGQAQRAASARGAVFEDTLGSANGVSKGLRVMPAVTNKMTNPIFGHSTWNTGWTDAANIIEIKNNNPKYCFPGSLASAFLTAKGTTNNTETQSINVGSTAAHYFAILVARSDGEAVTTSDCQVYYNAAISTTFTDLGNGIYLGTASATGINAATATGVIVYNGRSVYLLAMYCGTVQVNWVGCGDMLGWAWAGKAHESASTATVGTLSFLTNIDNWRVGSWAVAMAWKPDFASTNASDRYLFALSATFYCYYESGTDDFRLTDGTNTIDTTTATFSAGDELLIIASGGPSGLALYYYNVTTAQALSATGSYTLPANPTTLYIGTDSSSANHCDGIIRFFQTYGQELDSTEVGEIYAAMRYIISNGQRPDPLPWLWSAGDTINGVRNCLDASGSTDAPHYNYVVVGGVPGDIPPALNVLAPEASAAGNYTYISNFDLPYFLNPTYLYSDMSGTANADSSGGAYNSAAASTEFTTTAITTNNLVLKSLSGRPVYGFFRASYTGTGTVSATVDVASLGTSDARTITIPATFSLWHTNALLVPEFDIQTSGALPMMGGTMTLDIDLVASAAGTCVIDYYMIVPGPITRIASGQYGFLLREDGIALTLTATNLQNTLCEVVGDPFELSPDRYNILISLIGSEANDPAIAYTLAYSPLLLTPRWSLL